MTDGLSNLYTYGPLGVFCLVLCWAVQRLFGELLKSFEGRFVDSRTLIQENTDATKEHTLAIRALTEMLKR